MTDIQEETFRLGIDEFMNSPIDNQLKYSYSKDMDPDRYELDNTDRILVLFEDMYTCDVLGIKDCV